MSHGLARLTCLAAYIRFTPNNSEQRLPPPYYRGCWHGVSRGFLYWYRHNSSHLTELYDPKAFIAHTALLRQAFAHCAIFPTAASRRSLDRVSVPVWPFTLSGRLNIVALVSFYLTNKLMLRELILECRLRLLLPHFLRNVVLSGISIVFTMLSRSRGQIIHVLLTLAPLY